MTRRDPYAALRIPNYRLFITSVFTMTVAAQMQAVVVGWQVYAATKDPLSLGLIGLAEVIPFIGVALFAGHVVDRADRRRISVVSLIVLVTCSASLLALTLRGPGRGLRYVLPIYVVIAASGVARSFLFPARTALAAELVPRELYPSAIAWRSSTWQLAAVLGPAAGGLLYGFSGPVAAYVGDVTLMAIALLTMQRVTYSRAEPPVPVASFTESLRTGVRFVFQQPVLLAALSLDMFSVLFGGATALLPIFADQVLHVGPQGLGILQAAPAVGAVATSLLLTHRPPFRRTGRTLLLAVAIYGLCMIGFALSVSVVLSVALLVGSGVADNVSVVIRSTLIQTLTPAHLLGRVAAVNSIFVGSSNEIGAFESGVAARLLGTVPSVVFGGVMTLAVVLVTTARVPSLRRLREIR
jgi:MFS family permease